MLRRKADGKKICSKVRHCSTPSQKALGLMFSKKIEDEGMIFHFTRPVKAGLHMFFVFFAIDVLFLDKEKKIVEIKENFLPFTVYNPRNKTSYVIEIPSGCVKKNKLKEGQELIFADV